MPSSSARCSQLPRAADKLPFYTALRKLRDHLRGDLANLSDAEVTFPDLELKVEPKKESLDAEVKQEIVDTETNTANQEMAADSVTVGIKMEGDSVAGKQKKGRRKRSSTTESGGKEISASNAVGSSAETVFSRYFIPWQPAFVCSTESVRTRRSSTAAAVDTNQPVKEEVPFDFAQFGHMPEDLTSRRTYNSMLPLPDVKPNFSWHPANY